MQTIGLHGAHCVDVSSLDEYRTNYMNVTEYIVVADDNDHPKLRARHRYFWQGDLTTYEDMAKLLARRFEMETAYEEFIYVLAYDITMKFLGIYNASHGNSMEAAVRIKEIMTFVLLSGADVFVLVHNHPLGSMEISDADYDLTDSVEKAAKLFGVTFDEHLIITTLGHVRIKGKVKYFKSMGIELPFSDNRVPVMNIPDGVDEELPFN